MKEKILNFREKLKSGTVGMGTLQDRGHRNVKAWKIYMAANKIVGSFQKYTITTEKL
jgi:hypothetical protein